MCRSAGVGRKTVFNLARARLLKPGFFANEQLAEIPPFGRLLFAGLWTIADREGRLEDRPRRIKGAIFPYDKSVNVSVLLDMLEERGFIYRYQVDESHYLQIKKWAAHQQPHRNEVDSVIPAPFEPETSTIGGSTSSNGISPSTIGGSARAVYIAEAVPIAKAEAEAVDEPPAHPFVVAYALEHQQRNAGRPPSKTEHAAALALEREYGSDACFEVASDLEWSKHPNYMRPILQERREGKPLPKKKRDESSIKAKVIDRFDRLVSQQ